MTDNVPGSGAESWTKFRWRPDKRYKLKSRAGRRAALATDRGERHYGSAFKNPSVILNAVKNPS
jgi:hypothetical protein